MAVTSALFGLVRPGDRIPAYRLSGDVSLPGLGPVAGVWRQRADRYSEIRTSETVTLPKVEMSRK